jgi:hypothetical protein
MNINNKLSSEVQQELLAYDLYHLLGLIQTVSSDLLARQESVYCIGYDVYDEITSLSELEIIDMIQYLLSRCKDDVLSGKAKSLYLT